MADLKISQLDAVGSAAGTDTYPVVSGGITKKETVTQMFTLLGTTGLTISGAWTFTNAKIARSTTVIVAASNSTNKNNADYVCTGTADETIIQNAIASLPATGGTLVFLEGAYATTATITGIAKMEMRFCAGAVITYSGSGIALDFYDGTRGNMTEVTITRPQIVASSGTCLRLSGFHRCTIYEPYLTGKIGISLKNGNTARIIGGGAITKNGSARESGSIGIDVSDTTANVNDITIDINHIVYFEMGIKIGPSDYSYSSSRIGMSVCFEDNKYGVYIYTGGGHHLENCWFEGQTDSSVYVNNAGSNVPANLTIEQGGFNESGSIYNVYSVNYHSSIYLYSDPGGAGLYSFPANTKVFYRMGSTGISSFPQQSKARVYGSAAQSIPINVATKVCLDTETYDTQGEFDSTATTGTTHSDTSGTTLVATAAIFVLADVGKWVWNTTDNTYTTISGFTNTTTVTVGAAIFATGETFKFYNSRFTAKVAGYYQVIGSLDWRSPVAGYSYYVQLCKNGAGVTSGMAIIAGAPYDISCNCSDIIYLAATDYIELYAYHDSLAAVSVMTSSTTSYIAIHKLS